MIAKAEQNAAAATQRAQQQIAAEQTRAQDTRAQMKASYQNTQTSVQDMVAHALAEADQIRTALLNLQNTFVGADKLFPDSNPKEKSK